MGIKWRQEEVDGRSTVKLEFKGLVASLGHMRLTDEIGGHVERWTKWSFKDDGVPAELRELFEEGKAATAVPVRKKRLLRKIRLDAFGNDTEVPSSGAESFIDRGMGFELTRIQVRDESYWTLGFEAFPDDSALHEAFTRNLPRLLDGFPGGTLSSDNSQSYPAWLQRFILEPKVMPQKAKGDEGGGAPRVCAHGTD